MLKIKTVGEIFKTLFVIIFLVISIALTNAYMLIHSTSQILTKDTIKELINTVEIDDIISYDDRQQLYDEFEKNGIDKKYADAVLENQTLKDEIMDYANDIVNAVIDGEKVPRYTESSLEDTLIKVFDEVIEDSGDTLSQKEIDDAHQAIKDSVPELVEEINKATDEINDAISEEGSLSDNGITREELKAFDYMRAIFEAKTIILILALVPLLLIALLKYKDLKFTGWFAAIAIINCVLFTIVGRLFPEAIRIALTESSSDFSKLIEVLVDTMAKPYRVGTILCIVSAIAMIAIKIVANKQNKELVTDTLPTVDNNLGGTIIDSNNDTNNNDNEKTV